MITRREFLKNAALGIGAASMAMSLPLGWAGKLAAPVTGSTAGFMPIRLLSRGKVIGWGLAEKVVQSQEHQGETWVTEFSAGSVTEAVVIDEFEYEHGAKKFHEPTNIHMMSGDSLEVTVNLKYDNADEEWALA